MAKPTKVKQKYLIYKKHIIQKGIKMIEEKEKPRSLIDAMKQRIKYLEDNDPHNENLEVLKQHISEHDWKILPT